MQQDRLNQTTAALRVCVDQAGGGQLSGRVVGQRLTGPFFFRDVGSLLLQTEAVMDAQNFPQAFQQTRSFAPRSVGVPAASCLEQGMSAQQVNQSYGTVSTFVLYVHTRQHTTWQGAVDWLDGSAPQSYESVLELIKLIDRHLCPSS